MELYNEQRFFKGPPLGVRKRQNSSKILPLVDVSTHFKKNDLWKDSHVIRICFRCHYCGTQIKSYLIINLVTPS